MPRVSFKRWVITGALIGALGIAAAWVIALQSDACAIALSHAKQSPEVNSRFGEVRDLSLRSFQLTFDTAEFRLAVDGAKAQGAVVLTLQKDSEWRVYKTELEQAR